MKNSLFEMQYYDTYWFAHITQSIIENHTDYLRELEIFFLQNEHLTMSFPKYSSLHLFIDSCLIFVIDQTLTGTKIDDIQEGAYFWIDDALKIYKSENQLFLETLSEKGKTLDEATDEDLNEYYDELNLTGSLEDLREKITSEVFFILFFNRSLLREFNLFIAREINSFYRDENKTNPINVRLKKDGVLRRTKIPNWVQRAVFFRDRGRCALCDKDITGLVNIGNQKHFDHIVPLDLSGANDVTNIQLLCEKCNLSKKNRNTNTSKRYEKWY